jgi:peptidoglycan-N-acetylglucosamine deacetylase
VDRRRFVGSLAVAAGLVGGTTFGLEEYEKVQLRKHGRAVSYAGPPGPSSSTMFWRADTTEDVVALTFDDGPDPRYTPDVLRILDDHDAVATFFLQGNHVERHPGLAREVAERHAVGNHTYAHPDLGTATADHAHRELLQAHDVLAETIGVEPLLFRPPFGRFSGGVGMAAARMGYDVALWSDHINSRQGVDTNLTRLRRSVQQGDVILAHDGGRLPNHTVVDTLPRLLDHLGEQGLRLVTVTELLTISRLEQAAQLTAPPNPATAAGDDEDDATNLPRPA